MPAEIAPARLRDARTAAGMTQVQLAQRIGVAPRTIVYWESEAGTGVSRKGRHKVWHTLGAHLTCEHATPLCDEHPAPVRPVAAARRAALSAFTDLEILEELTARAADR